MHLPMVKTKATTLLSILTGSILLQPWQVMSMSVPIRPRSGTFLLKAYTQTQTPTPTPNILNISASSYDGTNTEYPLKISTTETPSKAYLDNQGRLAIYADKLGKFVYISKPTNSAEEIYTIYLHDLVQNNGTNISDDAENLNGFSLLDNGSLPLKYSYQFPGSDFVNYITNFQACQGQEGGLQFLIDDQVSDGGCDYVTLLAG